MVKRRVVLKNLADYGCQIGRVNTCVLEDFGRHIVPPFAIGLPVELCVADKS